MPADRFFGAVPEVLRTLKARVAANALELARHGLPRPPFYLTGQVGGQPFSLHASQSAALVLEVFRAAAASYGTPEEVLTDNGSQYVTWRGKGAFTRELEKRGVRQVVASPRHPQTLGKIERFWGTLWRECAEAAVFLDLGDAQRRLGLFIDHYNFQRPHQARVAANALELARHGLPRPPSP